jgi:hypothetical protein
MLGACITVAYYTMRMRGIISADTAIGQQQHFALTAINIAAVCPQLVARCTRPSIACLYKRQYVVQWNVYCC